jgi:hypothetical protein
MNGYYTITLKVEDKLYQDWNNFNEQKHEFKKRRNNGGAYGIVQINSDFFSEKIREEMEKER